MIRPEQTLAVVHIGDMMHQSECDRLRELSTRCVPFPTGLFGLVQPDQEVIEMIVSLGLVSAGKAISGTMSTGAVADEARRFETPLGSLDFDAALAGDRFEIAVPDRVQERHGAAWKFLNDRRGEEWRGLVLCLPPEFIRNLRGGATSLLEFRVLCAIYSVTAQPEPSWVTDPVVKSDFQEGRTPTQITRKEIVDSVGDRWSKALICKTVDDLHRRGMFARVSHGSATFYAHDLTDEQLDQVVAHYRTRDVRRREYYRAMEISFLERIRMERAANPPPPPVPWKRSKGEPLLRDITTKEQFAARLNGRDVVGRSFVEIVTYPEQVHCCQKLGLMVYYGTTDRISFWGEFAMGASFPASDLEEPSFSSAQTFLSDGDGPLDFQITSGPAVGAFPVTIRDDAEGFDGVVEVDVPHATFELLLGGERYLRGVVIDWSEANAAVVQNKA